MQQLFSWKWLRGAPKGSESHGRGPLATRILRLALASLVFGSLLEICDSLGYLGFLDRWIFTLVQVAETSALPSDKNPGLDKPPLILEIDDAAWLDIFHETNPLDRNRLADIMEELAKPANLPSLLAIDLDLSPVAGRADDAGQARLEAALAEVSSRIPVVVMTPLSSTQAATVFGNADWQAVVAKRTGVHFAAGCMAMSESVALDFDSRSSTLGPTAAALMPGAASPLSALRPLAGGSCLEATRRGRAIDTGLYRMAAADNLVGDADRKATAVLRLAAGAPVLVPAGATAKRPVFFGAAFGERDSFLTPVGRQYGVAIHTAAFATVHFDLNRKPPKGLPFLLDLFIGIVSGFLFERIWKNFNQQRRHFLKSYWRSFEPDESESLAEQWCHFGLSIGFLLAAFGVLAVFLALLILMARQLVAWGFWLNPAGMLFGMFIDTLIASREGLEEAEERETLPGLRAYLLGQWRNLRRATNVRNLHIGAVLFGLTRLFYAGIVARALYLIFIAVE